MVLNDKNILDRSFYSRDTSIVARELIGKILVRICGSASPGTVLSGMIIETEAYYGTGDPASHAYRGRTPRSEIMFGAAGMSYVYFCYGMYYLLNSGSSSDKGSAAPGGNRTDEKKKNCAQGKIKR